MKSFFLNSHASSKIFLSIKPVSLVIDRFHLSTRLSAGKEESLNRWRLRFPLYLVASEEKKNVKIKDSNVIYIFHLTRYATSEKIDQKMQNFKIAVHLEKLERGTFVIVSLIEKYLLSKVFVTFAATRPEPISIEEQGFGQAWFPTSDTISSCSTFGNAIRFKSNLCVKLAARADGRTAERTDDETNYLCAGPAAHLVTAC